MQEIRPIIFGNMVLQTPKESTALLESMQTACTEILLLRGTDDVTPSAIEPIKELLFRLSWRSSELTWSIKDGANKDSKLYKDALPWYELEFLAQALIQLSPAAVQQFISAPAFIETIQQIGAGTAAVMAKLKETAHNNNAAYDFAHFKRFVTPLKDRFYIPKICAEIAKFATILPDQYRNKVERAAVLRLLELVGEYGKRLSAEATSQDPQFWLALKEIRNCLQHNESNYNLYKRILDLLNTDATAPIVSAIVHELSEAIAHLPGATNVPLPAANHQYPTIELLAANSVLTFSERQALLAAIPSADAAGKELLTHLDKKQDRPAKATLDRLVRKLSCSEAVKTQIGEYLKRLDGKPKKRAEEEAAALIGGLSLKPKEIKLLERINRTLDQAIAVMDSGSCHAPLSLLAIEYYLQQTGVLAHSLLTSENFKQLFTNDAEALDSLSLFSEWRGLFAHRRFELEHLVVSEVGVTALVALRVDLQQIINKASTPAATEIAAAPGTSPSIHMDLVIRLHALYQMQYERTFVQGRLLPQTEGIGVTHTVDLIVTPLPEATYIDQWKFERALSRQLQCRVRCYTEGEYSRLQGEKLTQAQYALICRERRTLPHYLSWLRHNSEVRAGRVPENTNFGPRNYMTIDMEFPMQSSVILREMEEAHQLLERPEIKVIIAHKASIILERSANALQFLLAQGMSYANLQRFVQAKNEAYKLNDMLTERAEEAFDSLYVYVPIRHQWALREQWNSHNLPRTQLKRENVVAWIMQRPAKMLGLWDQGYIDNFKQMCATMTHYIAEAQAVIPDDLEASEAEDELNDLDNLAHLANAKQILVLLRQHQHAEANSRICDDLHAMFLNPRLMSPIANTEEDHGDYSITNEESFFHEVCTEYTANGREVQNSRLKLLADKVEQCQAQGITVPEFLAFLNTHNKENARTAKRRKEAEAMLANWEQEALTEQDREAAATFIDQFAASMGHMARDQVAYSDAMEAVACNTHTHKVARTAASEQARRAGFIADNARDFPLPTPMIACLEREGAAANAQADRSWAARERALQSAAIFPQMLTILLQNADYFRTLFDHLDRAENSPAEAGNLNHAYRALESNLRDQVAKEGPALASARG